MIEDKKYCRMCVSDKFIIYTLRQDGLFGKNVIVCGLPAQGSFENFGHSPKMKKYRFKTGVMADVFFETANLVMDYQDGLRNCIAPIDYTDKSAIKNPDNVWVTNSEFIGPYQIRKMQDRTAQYNKEAELKRLCNMRGHIPLAPQSTHVILDTIQTAQNGIFYIYNLFTFVRKCFIVFHPFLL